MEDRTIGKVVTQHSNLFAPGDPLLSLPFDFPTNSIGSPGEPPHRVVRSMGSPNAIQTIPLPGMMEQLHLLYAKAGLDPLDTFITTKLAENRENGMPDPYRGLGATSWLCARGILELSRMESDVILTVRGGTEGYTSHEMRKMLRQTGFLTGGAVVIPKFTIHVGAFNQTIHIRNKRLPLRGIRAVEFTDREFEERIRQRAQGPMCLIREVRKIGNRFFAYGDDDEYLMEIMETSLDPYRGVLAGFPVKYVGFGKAAQLPALPGPFALGETVVAGWGKGWRAPSENWKKGKGRKKRR